MESSARDLNRTALSATVHCLTGCAIGEVLGLVLATAFGWGTALSIAVAILLAFVFGYSLTMLPLVRSGLNLRQALPLAFASDTLSIATMEVVDSLIVLFIPGAMDAGLGDALFWGSLVAALFIAFLGGVPGEPLAARPRQGACRDPRPPRSLSSTGAVAEARGRRSPRRRLSARAGRAGRPRRAARGRAAGRSGP